MRHRALIQPGDGTQDVHFLQQSKSAAAIFAAG
jgi:hypothetical protein